MKWRVVVEEPAVETNESASLQKKRWMSPLCLTQPGGIAVIMAIASLDRLQVAAGSVQQGNVGAVHPVVLIPPLRTEALSSHVE